MAAESDRKYDYKLDTDNGKKLAEFGYTVDEVLQAGWYALQSRSEQNDKNRAIRNLAKKDPRFKSIVEEARKQVAKARGR